LHPPQTQVEVSSFLISRQLAKDPQDLMLKANSYYVPKGAQQSQSSQAMTNGNYDGNRVRASSFDQFLTSIDMSTHNENGGEDLGYLCRRILSGEDIRSECFGYRQLFGKSLMKPTVTNITPYAVSKSLGTFVFKMIQKSCQETNFEVTSSKLFKLFERERKTIATSSKTSTLQQRISTIGESLSNRFSIRQSAHISPEETKPIQPSSLLVPPIETITQFIYEICYSTQMEYECSVVSLIYLTRFMEVSYHKIQLNEYNWRSVVLSCMLIANKMWDDFHVSNVSYCSIFPGLSLERVNQLEIGLLTALNYNTWVSPSRYAENHFSIQACIAEDEIKQMKQNELVAQKSREAKLSSATSIVQSTPPPSTAGKSLAPALPAAVVPSTTSVAPASAGVVSISSEKITIRTVESQSISLHYGKLATVGSSTHAKLDETVQPPSGSAVPLMPSTNTGGLLPRVPSQSIPEEGSGHQQLSNATNEICQFIDRTRKTLMKSSQSHLLAASHDLSQPSFCSCLPFLCHNFHFFKDKI
jgi:hypothetical protein